MSKRVLPGEVFRPSVLQARPYQPESVPADVIKLDAMENPYRLPDTLRQEIGKRTAAEALNRYPDHAAEDLKTSLRRFQVVEDEFEIVLGNGSDELIQLLLAAIAGTGRGILIPEPTFSMYRILASSYDVPVSAVPLQASDFAIDLDGMLAAIRAQKPAITFLASPNNPTGNSFQDSALDALVHECGEHGGLVVIDQAYLPFCTKDNSSLLRESDNVVLLRTVSKVGLAGLRLGYLLGRDEWLAPLDALRLPYNVNVLTQRVASVVLDQREILADQVSQLIAERQRLFSALNDAGGVEVWPSDANFLLFRTEMDAAELHAALTRAGILIRDISRSHPLLDKCLRVTVGTPTENAAFLKALFAALRV